jgi:hypothetical protein
LLEQRDQGLDQDVVGLDLERVAFLDLEDLGFLGPALGYCMSINS